MGSTKIINPQRVEVLEVWAAMRERDQTEGRLGQEVVAYCELEATAERLSKDGGVMGSSIQPLKMLLVRITDSGLPSSWMAPVSIRKPEGNDRRRQDQIDKDAGIIARAKAAGLTDADIAHLRSGRS